MKPKKKHAKVHKDAQVASTAKKPREAFPYEFCPRKPNKKPLSQFHDLLLPCHYDIAFEVTWELLTPTALNPVIDETEPESYPQNEKGEYSGYNRRWLTIDGHLAISPFTVKSAIANGFANIMGGCYRVNNIEEGHKDGVTKGQYLYGGKYKRYRVAMDGSSKPGIVKDLKCLPNGDREITIVPVKEYYLDEDLSLDVRPGKTVHAIVKINRGNKPPIIHKLSLKPFNESIELKYAGPYLCGRDSGPHGKHKHRFYKETGEPVSGIIPAINFLPEDELKRHVSIGGAYPNGTPTKWYQDLRGIEVGSFVYYETFNGKVTNIGKNFLFKALFNHEDTVPEGSSECNDIEGKLCPRCSMFGMTDKSGKAHDSIGFKGRFKSSALINDRVIEKSKEPFMLNVKEKKDGKTNTLNIRLFNWIDKDTKETIASMEFLPISGPPKPNRRDVNGYFDKTKGTLKGAKYYLHGTLDEARNIGGVDNDSNYTHRLRNYAHVAKKGLYFTGTVGAENCTPEEIATFIMLLHSHFSGHGFKIGLGKAFGMGSVKSYIKKVWIRRKEDYETWHVIENKGSEQEFVSCIEEWVKDFSKIYRKFKNIITNTKHIINKLEGMENRRLKYPEVRRYWENAFKY